MPKICRDLSIKFDSKSGMMVTPGITSLRIAKEPLKMNISQRDLCVQFYTFIENYLDSPQVRDYEKLVGRCSELRKVKLVLYDYLTDTQDIEL